MPSQLKAAVLAPFTVEATAVEMAASEITEVEEPDDDTDDDTDEDTDEELLMIELLDDVELLLELATELDEAVPFT